MKISININIDISPEELKEVLMDRNDDVEYCDGQCCDCECPCVGCENEECDGCQPTEAGDAEASFGNGNPADDGGDISP